MSFSFFENLPQGDILTVPLGTSFQKASVDGQELSIKNSSWINQKLRQQIRKKNLSEDGFVHINLLSFEVTLFTKDGNHALSFDFGPEHDVLLQAQKNQDRKCALEEVNLLLKEYDVVRIVNHVGKEKVTSKASFLGWERKLLKERMDPTILEYISRALCRFHAFPGEWVECLYFLPPQPRLGPVWSYLWTRIRESATPLLNIKDHGMSRWMLLIHKDGKLVSVVRNPKDFT